MTLLVEALHLRKTFGETVAVEDVCLDVKAGEIFGLVGSDGAGKTTILRLLVGAMQPDRGQIEVCGYDISRNVEQARARLGYLSQKFSLYEDLSVLENIRFFAEVRGLAASEWLPRSMEILDFVGLAEFKDRRAGQLSGGMKQKLGLATAMVTRPTLLLLDEPTTGVDPVTRQDFWQMLIRLVSNSNDGNNGQQVSVIISTPYMDEAARCSRIGFMRAGNIVAGGTPAELRALLTGRVLELRGEPLFLLRKIAGEDKDVEDVQIFGDRLHLRIRSGTAKEVIRRLPRQVTSGQGRVAALGMVPAGLEDVFIALSESSHGGS
ncbi:MAG: ABC transporter ATP-binding protein [Anaerolineales bacterium]|nr:ABC transporter ATP-binding protein [Anaerolineales bacterium]